jgi:hypothetical protein
VFIDRGYFGEKAKGLYLALKRRTTDKTLEE